MQRRSGHVVEKLKGTLCVVGSGFAGLGFLGATVDDVNPAFTSRTMNCGIYGIFLTSIMGNEGFISSTVWRTGHVGKVMETYRLGCKC